MSPGTHFVCRAKRGGGRKLGEDGATEAEARKSFREGALGAGDQGSKAKAADECLAA